MTVRYSLGKDGPEWEVISSKRGRPRRAPDASTMTLRLRVTPDEFRNIEERANAIFPELQPRERVPAYLRSLLWPWPAAEPR